MRLSQPSGLGDDDRGQHEQDRDGDGAVQDSASARLNRTFAGE